MTTIKPGKILLNFLEFQEQIGKGTFGEVWKIYNKRDYKCYACKVERKNQSGILKNEITVMLKLKGVENVPQILFYGQDTNFNYVVMDLYKQDMEVYRMKNGPLPIQLVLQIASFGIGILEDIHSRGIIHRDIKPENLALSLNNELKIIDFGLSRGYLNNGQHIEYSTNRGMTGTSRYASIYALQGHTQSRRDDLEGLFYTLIYILNGHLPWIKHFDDNEQKRKYILKQKLNLIPEKVWPNIHSAFYKYFNYVRCLGFTQKPNYDYLRDLFMPLDHKVHTLSVENELSQTYQIVMKDSNQLSRRDTENLSDTDEGTIRIPQLDSINQTQQKIENLTSITDSNYRQVRLKDIKTLIVDFDKLDQFLSYKPNTLNEHLKYLYSLHMLMTSDQIQTIDHIVKFLESGILTPPQQITKQLKTLNTNHTQQIVMTENQYYTQQQQSMYLNVSDNVQSQEQLAQNEYQLTQLYFSYIQRIANNSDVYKACKFQNYPEEALIRKVKFLWLFKIINLLTFKLSLVPNIQMALRNNTANTLIIRDITYLIFKDCINEYNFIKNEISDMLDSYTSFQVKDCIQFYELFHYLKELTVKMKYFYDMKFSFTINSASVREMKFFQIDKKIELEIEHYVSKAKLINTNQFRKSLNIPNQKTIIENLHRQMNNPTQEQRQETAGTTKNQNKKIFQLFSPVSRQHDREYTKPQQTLEAEKN